jgi:hypothetical protein
LSRLRARTSRSSRTKFRTSVDRARRRRTASRSCHRSGCGCRRPPTPPRACCANDEACEFLRARASSSRAANSCRACLQNRHPAESIMSMHSRPAWPLRRSASSHGRWPHGARPHRRGDAGDLAPVDLAPVDIPSARTRVVATARCSHRNTTVKPTS